ncbi:MAG: HAD-IC family P-type ATPase [Ignavibacteria bacterium]|nr:HAD-IC family P-type ATPase [Ignavibacteria bacterium]
MNYSGLTANEVNERILKGLQNKSSKPKTKTVSEIIVENIFSVFNLVIFSIIIFLLYFYIKTSDNRLFLDSIGILTIALLNTFLAVFQEIKAKRALDKVSLLLKKEVTVVRDGQEISIDPSDIVKDDLIKILRGDQVVVDGCIIFSNHLEIDESLLTGESNPVLKSENDTVLSGSFCLSGNGLYRAEKIGDESYAARVTKTAKKYKFDLTPLQKKINFIVKTLFGVAVFLVLLELLLNKNGMNPDFIRKISTILISLVPQGLVLMATVTFAVGVYRISKLGAIIQKLNAIESFSNVKVVCTDKTGTLTQNKLSVHRISIAGSEYPEAEVKKLIGTYASLTSDKNATIKAVNIYEPDDSIILINEFPFSSERKMSLIEIEKNGKKEVLIFGAYDILVKKLDPEKKKEYEKLFEENKLSIYRNILFGKIKSGESLESIKDKENGIIIEPVCIISIKDLIREDVFDAIKLFEENGIQVKILSGDSAKSVQEVASEIGWKIQDSDMISGDDFDNADDETFRKIVLEKIIFARLKPEHKLRIIRTLKKEKIYTAMIGDGVNDLPAIKESDMGIAMEEGSSITKEVADIVLLKNKFSLLPGIFDEGNKIVNTVNSVGKLFITKNFFVILITLMSLFFFLDFPLTPRRVSLINIFGIGLPAFMITLKNTDTGKSLYFLKDLFSFVVISAVIIVTAGYAGVYFIERTHIVSEKDIQMVMLTIMIITNITNYFSIVLTSRETANNRLMYVIYGFLILMIYIFFAATDINTGIINLLKTFYEIDTVRKDLWAEIMIISFISSFLLFTAQKIRAKYFIEKYNGK